MKENTSKYFMAGTDEEVLMGDVISTELEKDFKDGRKLTREIEFELNEDTIPFALEMGIIEEGDEENDLIDFDDEEDFEGFREAVAQDIEELCAKIACLENRIARLEEERKPKQKNDSSKKK